MPELYFGSLELPAHVANLLETLGLDFYELRARLDFLVISILRVLANCL